MTKASLTRESIWLEMCLQFQRLVHYHGAEHGGSMRVLEKELRVNS